MTAAPRVSAHGRGRGVGSGGEGRKGERVIYVSP